MPADADMAEIQKRGQELDRLLPRAMRLVDRYYEIKATAGRGLTGAELRDRIVRRNLGIVESILNQGQRDTQDDGNMLLRAVLPAIVSAQNNKGRR